MKTTNLLVSVAAFALYVAGTMSAQAFETAQSVTATPITSVPFTISTPGNYYLPNDLVSTSPGVAITIGADQVVLDLNGRTLSASGAAAAPLIGIGIAVLDHRSCVIENGHVEGFGNAGVYFAASDKKKEHNNSNVCRRVSFTNDKIGCLIVSGSIDVVSECLFEAGSIGVEDVGSLGGDRLEGDGFQAQARSESIATGTGVLVALGKGIDTLGCVFAAQQDFGIFNASKEDKYRFNDFNSVPHHISGGTEENAGDL